MCSASRSRPRDHRLWPVAVLNAARAAGAGRAQANCRTAHGRAAFGILLFQDLAVLPMLAVLPLLAGQGALMRAGGTWWLALLKLLAVIAIVDRRRRAPGPASGAAPGRARAGERGVHRRRVAHRDRDRAARRIWPDSRPPSAPSSPACCSPTASSATSSRRISSPSRACCSDCSSSLSAWARTSICLALGTADAARSSPRASSRIKIVVVAPHRARRRAEQRLGAPPRLLAARRRRVRLRALHARGARADACRAPRPPTCWCWR